jgi:two-component system response regulator RegA
MIGLLVDDDALFLRTLQQALSKRGIRASTAVDCAAALDVALAAPLDFALVDLKIGKESGLRLIGPLTEICGTTRVVMMTGYASVATAVEAIKAGAHDYLLKPVSVDAILRVLADEPGPSADEDDAMRSTDGNISAAARLLGVHRRSLQRKLAKKPARRSDPE